MPEKPFDDNETSEFATGSDAYKARRLEIRLAKNLKEPNLFKNLPKHVQDLFLSEAHLREEELPVYGFFEDEETWIFSTTRRLLWSRPGFKHAMRYEDIRDINAPEMKKVLDEPIPPFDSERYEELQVKVRTTKVSLRWLSLEDRQGYLYKLLSKPGEIYPIWDFINFMAKLVQIHRGDGRT